METEEAFAIAGTDRRSRKRESQDTKVTCDSEVKAVVVWKPNQTFKKFGKKGRASARELALSFYNGLYLVLCP
jgi:hypothetical protein